MLKAKAYFHIIWWLLTAQKTTIFFTEDLKIQSIKLGCQKYFHQWIFSCEDAALQVLMSVSVCLCVCVWTIIQSRNVFFSCIRIVFIMVPLKKKMSEETKKTTIWRVSICLGVSRSSRQMPPRKCSTSSNDRFSILFPTVIILHPQRCATKCSD